MKKILIPVALVMAAALAAGSFVTRLKADDDHDFDRDHSHHFEFASDSLVLSRTVYTGTASTVTTGETLPPGCVAGTISVPIVPTTTPPSTTSVAVTCGIASDNGEFPNLSDSHNVWNNANSDGSFGVSSPIFLDELTPDGQLLDTLRIPSDQIVTSFSSKSELALNRSADGKSLTFIGYRGGPGCPVITFSGGIGTQGTTSGPVSPTAPNLIDVSASDTPGVCDPTNPVISSYVGSPVPTAYYRAVTEVDANGRITMTDGNAYSSDNGRAAMKGNNWLYYMAGNDNNGNLSKKQLPITQIGIDLTTSTGAELLVPGQTPPVPPNINMIGNLLFGSDKPGKDTNFRGLTIFDNTLYVAKGSGSNGINTVYQVGTPGTLPTPSNAPGTPPNLIHEPITILPGFPNTAASTSTAFPFGIWFAAANTLYVCDEGDGTLVTGQTINGQTNVADANTLATAGLQKWVLQTLPGNPNPTWVREYVIQAGLNLGVPYSVANYPTSLNPATDGCRNITGIVNHDGTVTVWAITSTVSTNGDQGADPNKLVKVTDVLNATTLSTGDGDHDKDDSDDHFVTVRSARAGEVFRGIALAPTGW